MLSLTGRTAVYLLYAYTRICSILRKAQADGTPAASAIEALHLSHPCEHVVVKLLLRFPEACGCGDDGRVPRRAVGRLTRPVLRRSFSPCCVICFRTFSASTSTT